MLLCKYLFAHFLLFIALLLAASIASLAKYNPLLFASGEFKRFIHAFYETTLQVQGFLPLGRGFSSVKKHHFAMEFLYVWSERHAANLHHAYF